VRIRSRCRWWSPTMSMRLMASDELGEVRRMRAELTGEEMYDFGSETVFVCEREIGDLGWFISASLRPWAEGCVDEPVPYIEGWWVAPDLRGSGVGRALVASVQQACRGCRSAFARRTRRRPRRSRSSQICLIRRDRPDCQRQSSSTH
jgi:GNAT superfamily N-acetyltransferase